MAGDWTIAHPISQGLGSAAKLKCKNSVILRIYVSIVIPLIQMLFSCSSFSLLWFFVIIYQLYHYHLHVFMISTPLRKSVMLQDQDYPCPSLCSLGQVQRVWSKTKGGVGKFGTSWGVEAVGNVAKKSGVLSFWREVGW